MRPQWGKKSSSPERDVEGVGPQVLVPVDLDSIGQIRFHRAHAPQAPAGTAGARGGGGQDGLGRSDSGTASGDGGDGAMKRTRQDLWGNAHDTDSRAFFNAAGVLEEIMALVKRHDRSIGVLGARWGMQSEAAFRNGLAGFGLPAPCPTRPGMPSLRPANFSQRLSVTTSANGRLEPRPFPVLLN